MKESKAAERRRRQKEMELVDVVGDGNCFFYAVLLAVGFVSRADVERHGSAHGDKASARALACARALRDALLASLSTPHVREALDDAAATRARRRLRKDYEWADNEEPQLVATVFGLRVCVETDAAWTHGSWFTFMPRAADNVAASLTAPRQTLNSHANDAIFLRNWHLEQHFGVYLRTTPTGAGGQATAARFRDVFAKLLGNDRLRALGADAPAAPAPPCPPPRKKRPRSSSPAWRRSPQQPPPPPLQAPTRAVTEESKGAAGASPRKQAPGNLAPHVRSDAATALLAAFRDAKAANNAADPHLRHIFAKEVLQLKQAAPEALHRLCDAMGSRSEAALRCRAALRDAKGLDEKMEAFCAALAPWLQKPGVAEEEPERHAHVAGELGVLRSSFDALRAAMLHCIVAPVRASLGEKS